MLLYILVPFSLLLTFPPPSPLSFFGTPALAPCVDSGNIRRWSTETAQGEGVVGDHPVFGDGILGYEYTSLCPLKNDDGMLGGCLVFRKLPDAYDAAHEASSSSSSSAPSGSDDGDAAAAAGRGWSEEWRGYDRTNMMAHMLHMQEAHDGTGRVLPAQRGPYGEYERALPQTIVAKVGYVELSARYSTL